MAPADGMLKAKALFQYYYKRATNRKKAPFLTPAAAAGLSVLFTLAYVIPFYLSRKTRPSPQLSRDAPTVIRARIRAVTSACVATSIATVAIGAYKGDLTAEEILQDLGWWPISLWDLAKTLSLVALLFLGPLFDGAIIQGKLSDWVHGRYLRETFGSAIGWRNFVAGPITEEIVFRSLIIPLHHWAEFSPTKIIFVTPLYFGIAHIHHFYEFTLTHPYTPLLPAILRSVVQFSYTSVFGFYAAFVFLRTGSLLPAVLAHSFCNWMGLPRFWGRVERDTPPARARRPAAIVKERMEALPHAHRAKQDYYENAPASIWWTAAYYSLLVAGAVGFYYNLWTLTQSPHALVDFSSSSSKSRQSSK